MTIYGLLQPPLGPVLPRISPIGLIALWMVVSIAVYFAGKAIKGVDAA